MVVLGLCQLNNKMYINRISSIISMVTITRTELQQKIDRAKSNIKSKNLQIKGAKKKIDFRGVRIQDQFDVGRLGIKPFRARGKAERKRGFSDLGVFSTELVGLKSSFGVAEKDLFDFDNNGGVL